MVNVGDTVFVAPLYGQKDNLAVISGPRGGEGEAGLSGVIEGDYNTWTKKWVGDPVDNICDHRYVGMLMDERSGTLIISYKDKHSYIDRFAIYNLSDFSVVFESPQGSDYCVDYPDINDKASVHTGVVNLNGRGASRSIQSYLLFTRSDDRTLEVWRGGAAPLWSRDVQLDYGDIYEVSKGGISLTGKYIIILVWKKVGYVSTYHLMLYEGSYV